MIRKVEPPRPITLLALFTFVVLAGIVFILFPVVFWGLSLAVGAVETMTSSNVAGDFSNIVFGNLLWEIAGLPLRHWVVASALVVVCTVLFVALTVVVNKK